MARLSAAQLYALARHAGLGPMDALTATAVALAESGGRSDATNRNSNGSVDRGPWQINSVHSQFDAGRLLADPAYNAEAMAELSQNGRDFSPWVTFQRGSYREFLPAASKAAGQVGPNWAAALATIGLGPLGIPLAGLAGVPQGVTDAVGGAVKGLVAPWGDRLRSGLIKASFVAVGLVVVVLGATQAVRPRLKGALG